ncbi:MAG TPA: hypothetical protein PK718_01130 [Candidatus Methanofastidiosa archaeon]|nr:hypothetical protein [Candidatus Methanofastidiosa archaeon]HPR41136.1 hypothetical protein [Candidatus Methanofastidiosa archaeon]
MAIIGIKVNKIEGSRNENAKIDGPVRIGSSPRILSVSESQMTSGTGKVKVVEFSFEYYTNYDPALGNIRVDGTVLYQANEDVRKNILASWKSNNLPKEISTEILTQMTQRSMLITMTMARELGLPSPLPLKISDQQENVQGG